MKTHTLLHPILFCALSLTLNANAATVSDYDFITAEIKRAKPITFEQTRELLNGQQTLVYSCYTDEALQTPNDPESYDVFLPYLSFSKMGSVQTELVELDLGYNISVSKKEEGPTEDLFAMNTQLECVAGEDAGTCAYFTFKHEKEFKIEKPGDDFSDKATRTESWQLYYIDEALYANRSIDFDVTELNWLGARKGSVTFSKRQVCHLTLK